MHKAQRLYNFYVESQNENPDSQKRDENSIDTTELSYHQVAKSSYDNLMKAVVLFEGVKDSVNLIVCHLNLGRFYRLSAHVNIFHVTSTPKAFKIQKKLYQQAFDSYDRALVLLGNRKHNPDLYDHVSWELSTATFNLAKQMQDNSSAYGSHEDVQRDVLDMLMKALKLCDIETNSSRQVLYMFRAGLIHQRIASLHHQALRTMGDESKRKSLLQLCRSHYEKAANHLSSLNEFKDYFKVQMERVALCEFLVDESTTVQMKMKNYQTTLNHFVESGDMLRALAATKSVIDADEILTLLELFETRLQSDLKSLIKLVISGKKTDHKSEKFKKMFGCTLRKNEKLNLENLVNHLVVVVEKISQLT